MQVTMYNVTLCICASVVITSSIQFKYFTKVIGHVLYEHCTHIISAWCLSRVSKTPNHVCRLRLCKGPGRCTTEEVESFRLSK